ncbi:MAG: energy transducer TonB [Muribaculaceae bacterium]|nr:energy transducer TonB [Muribaculaceae bacterium]
MKAQTILLTFGAALSLLFPRTATAQTCRVNAGITPDGCQAYRIVYEFDYVDEKPEFPGGGSTLRKYINKTRRYPAEAYARGVEGRVTCSFVVNPDGSVSHITVLKGGEPSLNREAVRILSKMPGWRPGRIDGQTVPVRVVCAVPFRK